jgi:hypothetical protein
VVGGVYMCWCRCWSTDASTATRTPATSCSCPMAASPSSTSVRWVFGQVCVFGQASAALDATSLKSV